MQGRGASGRRGMRRHSERSTDLTLGTSLGQAIKQPHAKPAEIGKDVQPSRGPRGGKPGAIATHHPLSTATGEKLGKCETNDGERRRATASDVERWRSMASGGERWRAMCVPAPIPRGRRAVPKVMTVLGHLRTSGKPRRPRGGGGFRERITEEIRANGPKRSSPCDGPPRSGEPPHIPGSSRAQERTRNRYRRSRGVGPWPRATNRTKTSISKFLARLLLPMPSDGGRWRAMTTRARREQLKPNY